MRLLVGLLLCLWAAAASADRGLIPQTDPVTGLAMRLVSADGTMRGLLCSGQTSTSTGCTDPTAPNDQIVADVAGYTSILVDLESSTASAFICEVYVAWRGYDGSSGGGTDRTTVSLTETQKAVSLDGALSRIWVECPTITGGSITAHLTAVKSSAP